MGIDIACCGGGASCVAGDVGNQLRVMLLVHVHSPLRVLRVYVKAMSSAGRGRDCVGSAVALSSFDDQPLSCFAVGGEATDETEVSAPIVAIGALPVISITAAAGVLARTGRFVESERFRPMTDIVERCLPLSGKPFC